MSRGDPMLGNLLFALFTLISITGTFLITQHLHSRLLAVLLSVALLIFFVVLYCALEALMRWLGL